MIYDNYKLSLAITSRNSHAWRKNKMPRKKLATQDHSQENMMERQKMMGGGMHKMPDGTMMSDKEMPGMTTKKKAKKRKK